MSDRHGTITVDWCEARQAIMERLLLAGSDQDVVLSSVRDYISDRDEQKVGEILRDAKIVLVGALRIYEAWIGTAGPAEGEDDAPEA